jgi:hypothetical protein
MGYYIETNDRLNKAAYIAQNHNARGVTRETFLTLDVNENGLVVVVNNGFFEAAAFCYNDAERRAFTDLGDTRPKQYLVMDRKTAEQLSGYR